MYTEVTYYECPSCFTKWLDSYEALTCCPFLEEHEGFECSGCFEIYEIAEEARICCNESD